MVGNNQNHRVGIITGADVVPHFLFRLRKSSILGNDLEDLEIPGLIKRNGFVQHGNTIGKFRLLLCRRSRYTTLLRQIGSKDDKAKRQQYTCHNSKKV